MVFLYLCGPHAIGSLLKYDKYGEYKYHFLKVVYVIL